MCTDTGWIAPKCSRRSEFMVVRTSMDELLVCRQLVECPARMWPCQCCMLTRARRRQKAATQGQPELDCLTAVFPPPWRSWALTLSADCVFKPQMQFAKAPRWELVPLVVVAKVRTLSRTFFSVYRANRTFFSVYRVLTLATTRGTSSHLGGFANCICGLKHAFPDFLCDKSGGQRDWQGQ